jgi:hypothetical protein
MPRTPNAPALFSTELLAEDLAELIAEQALDRCPSRTRSSRRGMLSCAAARGEQRLHRHTDQPFRHIPR